jgi:hypothetical protein
MPPRPSTPPTTLPSPPHGAAAAQAATSDPRAILGLIDDACSRLGQLSEAIGRDETSTTTSSSAIGRATAELAAALSSHRAALADAACSQAAAASALLELWRRSSSLVIEVAGDDGLRTAATDNNDALPLPLPLALPGAGSALSLPAPIVAQVPRPPAPFLLPDQTSAAYGAYQVREALGEAVAALAKALMLSGSSSSAATTAIAACADALEEAGLVE